MTSQAWIPSVFDDPKYKIVERILYLGSKYKSAFKILPQEKIPHSNNGTWARYELDHATNLWIDTSHDAAIEMYRDLFNERKESHMTKALTIDEKRNIKQLIMNNLKGMKSVLPKHLTEERMARIAYTAIVKNPKLGRCTAVSLINCVLNTAIVGLEIGAPLNLAHLIPFTNNKTNQLEAELIIDYKGYIELMYKSPLVKNISVHPVYSNDDFAYRYGTNQDIRHVPAHNNRGDLIAAYCIVWFVTGGIDFEVVDQEIAMDSKKKSRAKDSKDSPWNTGAEWTMWCKTAVRRISKRVPKSPELQKAILADDAGGEKVIEGTVVEDNEFDTIDLPGGQPTTEPETTEAEKPSAEMEPSKEESEKIEDETLSKIQKNYNQVVIMFPEETKKAFEELNLAAEDELTEKGMEDVVKKVNELLDTQG